MEKGYIHLYTGNGKGKTSAAIGLAIRALGADKKVFIGQFVKSMQYSEIKAITKYLPTIEHKQYGIDCMIDREPTKTDIKCAEPGLVDIVASECKVATTI